MSCLLIVYVLLIELSNAGYHAQICYVSSARQYICSHNTFLVALLLHTSSSARCTRIKLGRDPPIINACFTGSGFCEGDADTAAVRLLLQGAEHPERLQSPLRGGKSLLGGFRSVQHLFHPCNKAGQALVLPKPLRSLHDAGERAG